MTTAPEHPIVPGTPTPFLGLREPLRQKLSAASTGLGLGCMCFLVWGLALRLDRWEARSFILCIWGAVVCAVVATVLSWRDRVPLLDSERLSRIGLWMAVTGGLLWVWVPPIQRMVGWWIRQTSMLIFQ